MEWPPSFFSLKVPFQSAGYFTAPSSPSNYWRASGEAENKASMDDGAAPGESLLSEGETPGWPATSIWGDLGMFFEHFELVYEYRDALLPSPPAPRDC